MMTARMTDNGTRARASAVAERVRAARRDITQLREDTVTLERRLSMFGTDYSSLLLDLEVKRGAQLRMRLNGLELVKRWRRHEAVLEGRISLERESLRHAARSLKPRQVNDVMSPSLQCLTERHREAREQRIRAEDLVSRATRLQHSIAEKIGALEMEKAERDELVARGVSLESTRTRFLACLRGEQHVLACLAAEVRSVLDKQRASRVKGA